MVPALDSAAARRWLRAALEQLRQDRASLDELNVFPVRDRDTGTNMELTLAGAVDALAALPAGVGISQVLQRAGQAALACARGNSGALLAQFLDALGQTNTTAEWDVPALASALAVANDRCRAALAHPVEGTFITVAALAAHTAARCASQGLDLPAALAQIRAQTASAVSGTMDQLDILRQAGVPDAGAAGLAIVFDALHASATTQPRRGLAGLELASIHPRGSAGIGAGPGLEVTFALSQLEDAGQLRTQLAEVGESVAVIGADERAHVHVHTDDVMGVLASHSGPRQTTMVRSVHRPARTEDGWGLVVITTAPGLAGELARLGAIVVVGRESSAAPGELMRAVEDTGADQVVVACGAAWAHEAATRIATHRGGAFLHVVPAWCNAQLPSIAAQWQGGTGPDRWTRIQAIRATSWDVPIPQARHVLDSVAGELAEAAGGADPLVTAIGGQSVSAGQRHELAVGLAERWPEVEASVLDGGQGSPAWQVAIEWV